MMWRRGLSLLASWRSQRQWWVGLGLVGGARAGGWGWGGWGWGGPGVVWTKGWLMDIGFVGKEIHLSV